MWHLACGMLDDHKGSRTSETEGLRRLADMENWHIKVMSTVNLTGVTLKR